MPRYDVIGRGTGGAPYNIKGINRIIKSIFISDAVSNPTSVTNTAIFIFYLNHDSASLEDLRH